MINIWHPSEAVIFMKVGIHAKESLEDIIKRKQDEYAKTGRIFWGYGGNTCHPTKHVQPFAKENTKNSIDVNLVMEKIDSRHFAEPKLAEEYSDDGMNWLPIPEGIQVRGSRYAMVIGGLTEEEFDLNLKSAIVGVGPSRGRMGTDYIKGHVDKACFELVDSQDEIKEEYCKHISIYAPLMAPYAVFLR